jgi:hypothetical protein
MPGRSALRPGLMAFYKKTAKKQEKCNLSSRFSESNIIIGCGDRALERSVPGRDNPGC